MFETEVGYLDPEAVIAAQIEQSRRHGANLKFNERMVKHEVVRLSFWNHDVIKISTVTAEGETRIYYSKKVVLSVGAWAPDVYGRELSIPFKIERRVLYC